MCVLLHEATGEVLKECVCVCPCVSVCVCVCVCVCSQALTYSCALDLCFAGQGAPVCA